MGCESIIKTFFTVVSTIKLYHWQTKSYARHKSTDELHAKLLDLIDKFIEVYIGKKSRPDFKGRFNIGINELNDKSAEQLLENFAVYLKQELPKYLSKSDTELLNIRDELLAAVNQTLYLFTLN
jgi:hypothetical protein